MKYNSRDLDYQIYTRLENLKLNSRQISFKPKSVDEEERSIEAVFATEAQVEVFDFRKFEFIQEVLLADGFRFDKSIPALDSHHPANLANTIGSGRDMHVEKDKLLGKVFFADTTVGNDAFILAKDGHVRDLSIGYRTEDVVFIEEGKTKKIKGREFTGPLKVSKKTTVMEISVTPIGADTLAKFRSFKEHGVDTVIEELESKLAISKEDLENARQSMRILSSIN